MKRRTAGFTLAETLISVLLLGIVFAALAGGLHVFANIYGQITKKANAQTMLSTAVMTITDDLKNASVCYVNASDSTAVEGFTTSSRGYAITYRNGYTDQTGKEVDGIIAQPYQSDSSSLASIPLLTSKTNTNGMYTILSGPLQYENGLFTFTIEVIDPSASDQVMQSQTIEVRPYDNASVQSVDG